MPTRERPLIKIAGTGLRGELSRYLSDGIANTGMAVDRADGSAGPDSRDDKIVILELAKARPDIIADFSIFITNRPLEKLGPETGSACSDAEVVLIEWGDEFGGESEIGIERKIKAATGARKVLIYHDEESKKQNFQKMLDITFSKIGGNIMSDEIPEEVIAAVKEAAEDNKIACGTAQKIAHDLGVPIPLVGRALDLLNIKISKCQLGCF